MSCSMRSSLIIHHRVNQMLPVLTSCELAWTRELVPKGGLLLNVDFFPWRSTRKSTEELKKTSSKSAAYESTEVHHMVNAMRKSWWQCASAVANALAKYGPEVENAFQMEQRSITKNLNEIKSALESGKPVQSISPAFEWAQSGEWVYINAKMSHKLDAPATLNVVSEGVEMSDRSLKFAASKDHKRFALDLALHANIDPDPSSISWGSVGRVTFTLKKATGGVVWPSLLAEGQKKPVNMHVWWSKQEEYADEIDAIEEAVSEAAAAKTSKSGGDDAAGVQAAADASVEGVGAAAAAGDEGKGERESKPMTAEERMEKAKKEVSTAFSKEKKARFEELEREKRAAAKSIDAEATAKKKQAEEALRMKKAVVDEQFEELVQKKHAEIKAAAQASDRTEL